MEWRRKKRDRGRRGMGRGGRVRRMGSLAHYFRLKGCTAVNKSFNMQVGKPLMFNSIIE